MPAFRIFYLRSEASGPETVTAEFDDLDHALDVFAARGLRIVYIAETSPAAPKAGERRSPLRQDGPVPSRRSFPIRRFSARATA